MNNCERHIMEISNHYIKQFALSYIIKTSEQLANMKIDNVYRSRSPTNHVTFQADGAQRRNHRRLEQKLVHQIKLAEGRVAGLEARIQIHEDRFRDLEDHDGLMKNYKELSEAQNQFVEAQKLRISELEGQITGHTEELARTCKLNQDLSATIQCQDMTICELQKRVAEGASNYRVIANLFRDHTSYGSSCLDSKALNHAAQEDIFSELFPSDHTMKTTEVPESTPSQTITVTSSPSPALSRWHFKESASPDWQMTD